MPAQVPVNQQRQDLPNNSVGSSSLSNSLLGKQSQSVSIASQTTKKAKDQISLATRLDLALEAIEYAQNQGKASIQKIDDQKLNESSQTNSLTNVVEDNKTGIVNPGLAQATIRQFATSATPVTTSIVGGKERSAAVAPDVVSVDVANTGAVEYEPNPELPPEVEEYVERVEEHAETLSEPIVVDSQDVADNVQHHPTQPVVVLPITEEEEKLAHFKSPKYSIKWLVEWSHKIVKEFVGQVIYRMD